MSTRLALEPVRRTNWFWMTCLTVMLGLSAFALPLSSVLRAQEADEAMTEEETADGETTEAEGETTDTAADPAASGSETKADESFLVWLNNASGIFGYCIGIESFILVSLIVVSVMQLRRDVFVPPAFVEAFEQKLAAKDYQGAYEIAKKDDSFLARVLAAGLGKLSKGYDEALGAMGEVGEEENMAHDHKLSYISIIGTTAPMFGLLGTVQGMVASFSVIARSTTSPKPAELATGISMALVTTLEGLIVAIPAVIFFAIMKNRLARLVLEVGMVSEGLMSRFATVGKRPAAAAPGTAPAPAAPASPER